MASHERAGGNFASLERFDNFADTRNKLRFIAQHAAEWAGIPVPVEGESLVIEPSYPYAHIFNDKRDDDATGATLVNSFWSRRKRAPCFIWKEPDGKLRGGYAPRGRIDMELRTLGCSVAWGIEQESIALRTLATLVRHHTFKTYLLTGAFLETSPRSKITYMFRKLRPTLAIVHHGESSSLLCALCLHPIGHYGESWAGAMCPTDDVIAHLMLMRGDEHMFWKRSNQIPADQPNSGL